MASSKKITPEQAMQDLQSRKHLVQQSDASAMVKKFKSFKTKAGKMAKESGTDMPEFPQFLTYNKKAITKLLNKKGCVGLRIYPALRSDNNFTIVMVGVDEKGDNMLETEITTAPATKGAKMMIAKDGSTTPQNPTGTLDEGQASPPYPPPGNNL